MTKRRSTKSALISAALILAMTFTSFVGTTFAWFTDSVTSANNIIKSGNLDVEVYYQNDTVTSWTKVDKDTNVFKTNTLWEPGHVEVIKLKVVNEGSLSFKYTLGVNVASEVGSVNVNGEDFKLSDYIKFGIADGAEDYSREEAIKAVADKATALSTSYRSNTLALDAKNDTDSDEQIVTLVVYMPESVGNDANAKAGAATPTINLGISVFATQTTAEKDSFDDQYDSDAPITYTVNSVSELKNALAGGGKVLLGDNIEVSEMIAIPAGVTAELDLNGKTISGGYQANSTTKHIYPIENYGDLTITGGTIEGRGIYNRDGAKLTINGATVKALDTNGGACVWSYGTGEVYLNDANLIGYTGCVSSEGYLEINGGTYTCYSGISDEGEILTPATYNIRAYNGLKITGGTFTSRHGVISMGGGDCVIEGGDYTINFVAATTSNVLYVYGDANVTVNGGNFISDNTNNKADSGAAVLVSGSNSAATINGGNFVGMNGMVSGNVTLYGGTFNTVWDYNHYDNIKDRVAEGYKATQNTDGSWTISQMDVYEKGEYEFTDAPTLDNIAGALDVNKSVAVRLPQGETSTPSIALDFTGSTDNNFAIVGNDTVFTGDLQISSHPNFHLGDNAELIIDGITVNGTLKVVAYYKNIVIRNVKAQSIEVNDGGNVTIENCVVDGSSDNGIYVVATANGYNLTLKGNTVKNCAKNAVQISGCASGATYGAGKVVVTGNTFENWCTKNDKPRAAFKVWGDSVLAPSSISDASQMTDAATSLVNAIKNGNNNFISDSSNANQVQYDFYDCIL